jgi:ubiquinone/menaquinone biosynthesis C-methylase UbiE
MAWLFFKHRTNLLSNSPKKMLHVSPEKQFEKRLKKIPGLDYITADLNKPNVMVKMDLTNIQFSDNSFDIIFCSHVLEHIDDDRKAMRELCRVLKPSGWAAIMVPLRDEKTFEDSSITDSTERKRIFGEADHVRRYGLDIEEKLKEAGFSVTVLQLPDVVSGKNIARFGIRNQRVFFCQKINSIQP